MIKIKICFVLCSDNIIITLITLGNYSLIKGSLRKETKNITIFKGNGFWKDNNLNIL